jgi:hypothetical protein
VRDPDFVLAPAGDDLRGIHVAVYVGARCRRGQDEGVDEGAHRPSR